MKIFIYSPMADGCGIAQQMSQAGHEVMMYIADEASRRCFDGLIWKSQPTDWVSDARQADFVFFDTNKHGQKADWLRSQGLKVWGGGAVVDRLEYDRGYGQKVMEKAGIPTPETFPFSNCAEAMNLIRSEFQDRDRIVIKLDDSAGAASSYLSKDKADCIAQVESWEREGSVDLSKGGIVQRFVKGREISVEGWFNGDSFCRPFNVTLELKRLATGDVGPNTGCSWNLVKQLTSKDTKLPEMLLEPLTPLLRRGGYTGQIDVNVIVSESDGDVYALEFTPRAGYDATSTLALALEDIGHSMAHALGIADGKDLNFRGRNGGSDKPQGSPYDYLTAVRAYIPPYPFEAPGEQKLASQVYDTILGVPIEGWDLSNRRFVLYDAVSREGKLVCGGTCGVIGIALGRGTTLKAAVKDGYDALSTVHVPNLTFRTDGGEAAEETLELCRRYGLVRF